MGIEDDTINDMSDSDDKEDKYPVEIWKQSRNQNKNPIKIGK